jgi:hypothetical protein
VLLALVVLLLGLNWPIMKIGPGVYTVQVRRVLLEADAVAEASSTSHPIVVVSAQAPAMSESLPDALPSALQGSTARQRRPRWETKVMAGLSWGVDAHRRLARVTAGKQDRPGLTGGLGPVRI